MSSLKSQTLARSKIISITGASLTAVTVTVTVPAELVKALSLDVNVNVSEVFSPPLCV